MTSQLKSAKSPIAFTVTYGVLKPEPELSRLRLLRKAVEEHFAQDFRTLTEKGPKANMLTVFLTDSGEIDKAQISASPDEKFKGPLLTAQRFVALGVNPDRVGSIGKLMLSESSDEKSGAYRGLFVVYGWPRRAEEHGPTIIPEDNSTPPGDDPTVDLAIAERYFPDEFTTAESISTPFPWVLLDRTGKVLGTGRLRYTNSYVLINYLESIYPGIKINGFFGGEIRNAKGQKASMGFLWLAQDSPVTNLSRVDLARRSDVFLKVTLSAADVPNPIDIPIALKFGVPTLVDESTPLKLPVKLQAVATDAGAHYVDIEMQIRSNASTAVPTWSPNAPKLRVDYGADATMSFQDDKKRTWKMDIRPERLDPQRM